MHIKQGGFTFLEMLIALALSSAVLMGAGKLFPALQHGVLLQYQQERLQESLWQLAFMLGKNLRRAGYCNGECRGSGLMLFRQGSCVIIRWDSNSNGAWEPAGHKETDQTGYRLQAGSLETLRGATSCDENGWQKISDPEMMTIDAFTIIRQPRLNLPPLLEINLAASSTRSRQPLAIRHIVVGYNL